MERIQRPSMDDVILAVGGLPPRASLEDLKSFSGDNYLSALVAVKGVLQEDPTAVDSVLGGNTLGPLHMKRLGRAIWTRPRLRNYEPAPGDEYFGREYVSLRFLPELDRAATEAAGKIVTRGTLQALVLDMRDDPMIGPGPVYTLDGEAFFVPATTRPYGRNFPHIFLDPQNG